MNLKVLRHDNPTPAFKRVETIFADFFPDAGENMKLAVLKRPKRGREVLPAYDGSPTGTIKQPCLLSPMHPRPLPFPWKPNERFPQQEEFLPLSRSYLRDTRATSAATELPHRTPSSPT